MQELLLLLILFATGILAGISNAVAGGGTFFTFPVFIARGIPPVAANASNAVAVWPGHALAVVEYRRELRGFGPRIRGSMAIALAGGIVGALLLVYIGNAAFAKAIPFLILFATLLFACGGRISNWLPAVKTVPITTNQRFGPAFWNSCSRVTAGFSAPASGSCSWRGCTCWGCTTFSRTTR